MRWTIGNTQHFSIMATQDGQLPSNPKEAIAGGDHCQPTACNQRMLLGCLRLSSVGMGA
jgi:hypothetical protein